MFPTIEKDGKTTICLEGEVDLAVSPQTRRQILDILYTGKGLTVQLAKVDYIDSSGVACLVEAYQYARKHSISFDLEGVNPAVMRVLKLAKLDAVLPIR
ncbi:MAG: anti-sigma factor antagonist [Gammaproteobacteria bacterium]|nr:anti-sigma factor antagonist [Gammaproteobacteria bacterium]